MVNKKIKKIAVFIIVTLLLLFLPAKTNAASAAFDGTFITFVDSWSGINHTTVGPYIDEISSLGMKTLIIMDLQRVKEGTDCTGNVFNWGADYDATMKAIFAKAQAHGMDVYVGLLGHGGIKCDTYYLDPQRSITMNFLKDYASPNNPISYVINNFGSNPSFKGWYISDEPAIPYIQDQVNLREYYKQYAAAIKAKSNKPILISPFMVGVYSPLNSTNDNSPTNLAQRAYDFKIATGIDVQIWQDSVNTYGVSLRSDNIGHRYTTHDYYAALSAKLGKSGLWSDNELGNCCIATGIVGGGYYPASIARINNQLYSASPTLVDKHISWVNQYQMDSLLSGKMEGSERLMKAYGALYGYLPQYQYLKPVSYTWLTPPASAYPDTNNSEMFDMIEGEGQNLNGYANWTSSHYTGILGSAELVADMGKNITLAWVGVNTLNRTTPSIYFPDSLNVQCSKDNVTYSNLGTFNLPVAKQDSEYVISNTNGHEFNSICRYIKIKLNNNPGAWTFLSEIEIIGKTTSNPSTATVTPQPVTKTGDVNGDGRVDIIDIGVIVDNYSKAPIQNPKADANHDGVVDIIDIGIAIDNYGK